MKKLIPSWIWWELGIDPNDPADWPLMSEMYSDVADYYGY